MKKDLEVYTLLTRTGHATRNQLLELTSQNRLKDITRKNYLKKTKTILENGEILVSYKLDELGKKSLEKERYIDGYYSARSPEHDIKLAEKYLSLNSVERDTWVIEQKNEVFLNRKFNDQMSMPDASYLKNGRRIFIEAITKHYSLAQIQEKYEFVDATNGTLEILE